MATTGAREMKARLGYCSGAMVLSALSFGHCSFVFVVCLPLVCPGGAFREWTYW